MRSPRPRAAVEEGIVPGGGTALLSVLPEVQALLPKFSGDAKTGVQIVLRALEEPVRQIAANAGMEGSVIVEKIKRTKKPGYGYDALNDKYVDMVEAGIIDPTKVTRSALQNAASVAATVLTTESLVADIPEKNPAPVPAGDRAWAACTKRPFSQTAYEKERPFDEGRSLFVFFCLSRCLYFPLPCAPHGLHALQGEYPCFTAAARVANVMRLLC